MPGPAVAADDGGGRRIGDRPVRRIHLDAAQMRVGGEIGHGVYFRKRNVGVGQPLQHEHTDAFGPAGAVRVVRKGLAPAVGGQAALPGEFDEDLGAGEHGRAAGQRHRALAGAQGLRRQVVASELLLPADIEREFRITGGHWHHGELALDQFMMMRPVPGAAGAESSPRYWPA